MEKGLGFHYSVPKPPEGPLVEMTAQEAEKLLLKRLEEQKDAPADALWELARFYQQSRQIDKGLNCLRRVLALMPDAERKASCVLGMGQMMETLQDYEAAVRYYKEAFALEPANTTTWYFINNNLGFSLNTLGHFAEGDAYCRQAITVDPNRPNAYKNLGIALAGQGQYREAAVCFVTATRANASDPRSARLLQDLLKTHPELEYEFGPAAQCCEQAIAVASQRVAEFKPVIYRGWKKHLVLLWARLRALPRRLRPRH